MDIDWSGLIGDSIFAFLCIELGRYLERRKNRRVKERKHPYKYECLDCPAPMRFTFHSNDPQMVMDARAHHRKYFHRDLEDYDD